MTGDRARRAALALGAVVLVLRLGACGDAPREATVSTTIDSSGGFPVVRHAGTPPTWRAELVTTIGADTGGPYEFGLVASLALDSRGAVHVLDAGRVQVSVFDSLGRFVGVRGRRGRGPGEFTSPFSIALLHDTLVVLASSSVGLVQFAPDGEWLRTSPATRPSGEQDLLLYGAPPDAFWFSTTFRAAEGIRDIFVRYTSAGATDTIEDHTPTVAAFPPITCDAGRGGFTWYPVPFGPRALSRPLPSGELAVAVSSAYRVDIVARGGDTLRAIVRDVAPGPIGEEEWAEAVAGFRTWRATRGNPKCTRETFERPATRSLLERLFLDDEGRLWVESRPGGRTVYEVFGADGSLVAAVEGLPPSQGVDPSVRRGRIALLSPDSADVPRVQVFRLRAP